MLSKIYSSLIKFLPNHDDDFVAEPLCSLFGDGFSSLKPLNPQHPSIPKYTSAISKLFSEITITSQTLWIVPLTGTSTVRVYFSNPELYPISLCCQKCVYLQIQSDLSGSIICPYCQLILVNFIHYDDSKLIDGKITQIQKERLFKEKKRQNMNRNKIMYENLTSHRYKNKNLKNILSTYASSQSCSSSLLITSTNKQCFSNNNKVQQMKDGFILELRSLRLQNLRLNQNNQQYKNQFNPDKYLISPSDVIESQQKTGKSPLNMKSIQQTKQIIFDIFK